jgi:NAD(P)-dependent dehydrogenase (short-subunit alcohol dehydrogenase family)
MELRGSTIVVTGAASGIGLALARRFAEESPRALVLADLPSSELERAARALAAVAVAGDVGSAAGVGELISRAREAAGPIDLFFSNAGVGGPPGGPEAPDADWQRTWEVNVMAHVWAARELLPEMLERGEGYLACTASAAGLLTQVSAAAYSVTKHAAVAFAEWLQINYADRGIRVSCLCPQGVRTPMLQQALEDPVGAAPLLAGGVLEPEQVAEVTVEGLRREQFLILPHPQVAEHLALKGSQPDRWLAGMRSLVRRARQAAEQPQGGAPT